MMNSTAWAGVVAAVLCVCMFICLADGVGSGAVDGEKSVWKTMMTRETNGTCGEDVIWVWSGDTLTLTIKGTGNMSDYSADSTPWSSHASEMTTIVIENGVTSIGNYAFSESGVKNVRIPGSVKTIGKSAFCDCVSLVFVFIPDSVTSIGKSAFNCSLSTVFYEGTHDLLSEDVFNVSAVDTVCVPQDYNSSTFCGIDVTSDNDRCQEFQSMFSYCSKPVYIDGGFILQDRYETGEDGCVMNQCNDEIEAILTWSLCNRTNDEERICLEEECINNEETIDKKISIRIKLERVMEVKEIVEQTVSIDDELRRIMQEECGIEDEEEMMIGWQTDEGGRINEFVIYVDDEEVFKNRTRISRIIQDQWNSMQYPRAKEVEISRKHVCLNEACKKNVYVEIELDSIEEGEPDVDEILEILKEEIGIDTSRILIG